MNPIQSENYSKLTEYLFEAGFTYSPAFFHGFIAGYLCNHGDSSNLKKIIDDLDTQKADIAPSLILQFAEEICACFTDLNKSLPIYIPNDDTPLQERVLALSAWCQGFMRAISEIEINENIINNNEYKEIINDINAISEAFVNDKDNYTLSEEQDFLTICEHLKVCALNLYFCGEKDGL